MLFYFRKLDELFLKIRNGNKINLFDIIIVSKIFYFKLYRDKRCFFNWFLFVKMFRIFLFFVNLVYVV